MEDSGVCDANGNKESDELSKSVKARIERNRQRAVLIRQEKANKRLYTQIDRECNSNRNDNPIDSKRTDIRGGFILEEEDAKLDLAVVHKPGALLYETDKPICDECCKTFNDSFLYDTFMESICDGCKDMKEKHKLITKTEAKETYLLKDCDFELREPPLKFLLKKSSLHTKYGEMKLYLECQVAQRAAVVWGSDEQLEKEKIKRDENRDKIKKRKFDKKMDDLRRSVRSSLYNKPSQFHVHEYGEENYREVDDMYFKTCTTCGHTMTYDKL